jgi:hypothetical protein
MLAAFFIVMARPLAYKTVVGFNASKVLRLLGDGY